ncbi:hypothetical protein [uncultured Shewanella sp.]|uniref:hypothetical protein n=1 Tax=uncultured Shewanella sp. TaxID=173975 RepID=UPI00260FCDB4|nr:hypothetical protein [uncultured Shewanella sp.]
MSTTIQPSSSYINSSIHDNSSDNQMESVKSTSQDHDTLRELRESSEKGFPSSMTKLYQLSLGSGEQAQQAEQILASLEPKPINLDVSSKSILQAVQTLDKTCNTTSQTNETKAARLALTRTFGSDVSTVPLTDLILTNSHKDFSSSSNELDSNNTFQSQSQYYRDILTKNK